MPTFTINAGHISRPRNIDAGQILTVNPGTGATATVEYTLGSLADINNNVAVWLQWPKGPVATALADLFEKDGFIRVTAVGGNVSYTIDSKPGELAMMPYGSDWSSQMVANAGLIGTSGTRLLNRLPLSTVGYENWMGRMGVFDLTVPGTFQATIALKAPIIGCRIVYRNNSSIASPTINSMSVSNPLTVADVNNSAGTWVQGTYQQNAQMALDCPRGNGGIALAVKSYSDFIPIRTQAPTDGSTRHLLTIRATFAAFSVASFGGLPVGGDATTTGQTADNYTNWATRPDGDIRIWRFQTGSFAGAGTQSGFTSTTNISQCAIEGVILYFENMCVQHYAVGDSNTQAAGATYRDDNQAMRVARQLNQGYNNGLIHCYAGDPWSGQAGNGYNGFYVRGMDQVLRDDFPLTFAYHPNASPNDAVGAITQTIVDTWDKNIAELDDLVRKRGAETIMNTMPAVGKNTRPWSTDTATPAPDIFRQTKNANDLKRNTSGRFCIDTPMNRIDDYNGQQQPVSNTGDQTQLCCPWDEIHYSDAVYDAMAAKIIPYVKSRLGA